MLSWLRLCTAHVHAHHSLGSPRPPGPMRLALLCLGRRAAAISTCRKHAVPPSTATAMTGRPTALPAQRQPFPETPRQTACSIVLTAQSWCARARTEREPRSTQWRACVPSHCRSLLLIGAARKARKDAQSHSPVPLCTGGGATGSSMLKAESHKRRYRGICQFAGSLTRIQSRAAPARGSAAPCCPACGVRGRAAHEALSCQAARSCPPFAVRATPIPPLSSLHSTVCDLWPRNADTPRARSTQALAAASRPSTRSLVTYLSLWYKRAVTSGR